MSSETEIPLKIEFGGGLELLFSNQRSHRINIPSLVPQASDTSDNGLDKKPADVAFLILYLRDNLLKERAELFEENGTVYVRPQTWPDTSYSLCIAGDQEFLF